MGGNLKASGGGAAEVYVRDGNNAAADYLDNFRCLVSEHDIHLMDQGIYVGLGLFVDLGANVEAFYVLVDYDVPDATSTPSVGQAV
jgi:hypothetical protein